MQHMFRAFQLHRRRQSEQHGEARRKLIETIADHNRADLRRMYDSQSDLADVCRRDGIPCDDAVHVLADERRRETRERYESQAIFRAHDKLGRILGRLTGTEHGRTRPGRRICERWSRRPSRQTSMLQRISPNSRASRLAEIRPPGFARSQRSRRPSSAARWSMGSSRGPSRRRGGSCQRLHPPRRTRQKVPPTPGGRRRRGSST